MRLNRIQAAGIILFIFIGTCGFFYFLYLLKIIPRPNVILITVDALRADHLGSYGYELDTSPNMDRFAGESTLFSQAISQGSVTATALPSLHTSAYPRTHGVYSIGQELNIRTPTLAQILKKNNYTTLAIVSCIGYIHGLERGFDAFNDIGDVKAGEITRKAISWLEKNQQEKFFLWLHYFYPHAPYRPPPPYNRMFADKFSLAEKSIPISKNMYYDSVGSIPGYAAEGNIRDLGYYLSQYDGAIRFTDEQIGILLREIKELGLDKNSIIIITSDHGELLGEHGLYFRHGSLYDQALRVPLFIKCGKIVPGPKVIYQQVRLIDVVPTILALLHIPKGRYMQGESLLPLIFGKNNNPHLCAISEYRRLSSDFSEECIRDEGWKLVHWRKNNNEDYELYNLNLDPGESNNLVNIEKEKLGFLKKKIDDWHRLTPAYASKIRDVLDEEEKNLLRSLGYMQ